MGTTPGGGGGSCKEGRAFIVMEGLTVSERSLSGVCVASGSQNRTAPDPATSAIGFRWRRDASGRPDLVG